MKKFNGYIHSMLMEKIKLMANEYLASIDTDWALFVLVAAAKRKAANLNYKDGPETLKDAYLLRLDASLEADINNLSDWYDFENSFVVEKGDANECLKKHLIKNWGTHLRDIVNGCLVYDRMFQIRNEHPAWLAAKELIHESETEIDILIKKGFLKISMYSSYYATLKK
ncbi:hypothetical protein FW778_06235 [Ginsengibacter hankyongi]|uniref:Uncharacterized protein n=1 Tax=Ginsengibacter hankyongi TaxID=2607284 RepID=A0A5J5IKQ6_9BACT|nr:hypothetical protein [Ginsengibacter hankyongi]KAA9041616.1 hypothetical protein FW778_06235 [Ginsengibacter hankyongi]